MTILDRSWEKEVRQGRLVVLPNDDSYIQEVGVLVSDIVDQLADGLTAIELTQLYPSLTEADIRDCRLFVYLRAVRKI